MSIDLEQSILDGGNRFVNFFEGRILTGRDLRDEQTATRRGRKALGEAIGTGVVWGMEVTDVTPGSPGSTPVVRVTEGLALNREGQTLKLGKSRMVRLSELALDDPARSAGAFGDCDDQPSGSAAPTAEGFHLLTLAPASGFEEEAPKIGLGEDGTAGSCGRRYATLGLRFRLVQFDPAVLGGAVAGEIAALALATGDASLSRLRNHVAHLGLGTVARAGFTGDPFATQPDGRSAWADWGLTSALSAGEEPPLSACEVPLAVLRLRGGQLSYVDMWTVRRRPETSPREAAWPLIASASRAAADEATLFQFQRQLDWLFRRLPNPSAAVAASYFRYLPPVGLLPLPSAATFLQDSTPPLALAPGRVLPIIEEALAYPAVDLAASPAPGFTLYSVTGAPGWTLFVSDVVPSAEKTAEKCAALEQRIEELEQKLEAPGIITGQVLFAFQTGLGTFTQPIPGVVLRATAADGTETSATTDNEGTYTLTLPPDTYDLTPIVGETVLAARTVSGIEVTRGGSVTQNFTLTNLDFAQ